MCFLAAPRNEASALAQPAPPFSMLILNFLSHISVPGTHENAHSD